MEPASFPESTRALGHPEGWTADECMPLCIIDGMVDEKYPVVISCWKMTQAELDEVIKTGRVWLTVYGNTMPPVCLDGIKPFVVPPQPQGEG